MTFITVLVLFPYNKITLVLPNYIFTYNGNQYVRVTPYAYNTTDVFKFSDDSQIGQVKAVDGSPSNYRFFRIEPIKWIVLNYNYLPTKYGNGGDGTHTRLELLANDVLVSGVAPDEAMWKNSTINTYLNNSLMSFNTEAFKAENKSRQTTSVIYNNTSSSDANIQDSGSNANYLGSGSNPTTQTLYLLGYYELFNSISPYVKNSMFRNNSDKMEPGTDYARAHYLGINAGNGNCGWWLRTTNGTNLYRTETGGSVSDAIISDVHLGTRPAMHKDDF